MMDKRKRILELMPMINEIKDDKLREGVITVWVQAWEDSEWQDLANVFFNVKVPNCSLIDHTNFVAVISKAMADFSRVTWQTRIDYDLLIAAAILHDVSSVVERAPAEGTVGKDSEIGEKLAHSSYGVYMALKAGLPLDVVNIISVHSPKIAKVPFNNEGVFIFHADMATADMFALSTNRKMHLEEVR
ncbi:HDIG domain-containing metalloprotein [Chloroflexota bacterium]